MSAGTIGIVVGAYVFLLVLAFSLLTSSKRAQRASERAVERERMERALEREGEHRDVA